MKQTIPLMLALSLLWLSGCATQGRLTYLKFEQSFNYEALDASMEKLKRQGYDGSIQQQMSALREARYISKHMGEPGKREIALRALIFLAFASDDGDVRDRSFSRLETVLESAEWPTYLKFAVIDGTVDFVSGELGFQEEHDGMMMHFGVKSGLREDALEFLLESFENFSPELQYHAVNALHRFLLTPPTLDNCPVNLCDEDVRKNLEEWEQGREVKTMIPANADPNAVAAGAYGPESKHVPISEREDWNEEMDDLKETVWKWLETPLEDRNSLLLIRGRFVRFAGEIESFSLQEDMADNFREIAVKWSENEDVAVDLRQLLAATREKVLLYGYPATKPPVPSEKNYAGMHQRPPDFIETHLDAILHQQQQRQQGGLNTGSLNPLELVFTPFEKTEEAQLKREILLDIVSGALKTGLYVNTRGITKRILNAVGETKSEMELRALLKFVSELYPSFKAQRRNPRALLETLAQAAMSSESLARQRFFVDALLAGVTTFPEDTNLSVSMVTDLDVVTQHQIEVRLQNPEGIQF